MTDRTRVLVAGASGYAGALAARAGLAPPAPRAGGRDLAQRGRHARSTASTRATACPIELTELDLDAARGRATPRSSPTRTAPRRRWSPRCAGSGCRSSTSRPTSGSATPPIYERWYGAARRARAARRTPSTGSPSSTASGSATAELVANPGCYPTAALLALAPLAERGPDRRRRRSTPSPGVSGAGRGGGRAALASSTVTENVMPYGVDGHRHVPEIEQELQRARAPTAPVDLRPAPAAARPGPAGELLRRPRPSRSRTSCAALYAERYADEPFVEVVDEPPGVRDVRDTNLCRIHAVAARRAAARSSSPRSTTSGRAPPGRRSRT